MTLTFGSPSGGWPSFCPTCGKRSEKCDAAAGTGAAACEGAVRRGHGFPDRLQKGRSMEQHPKPRPI